MLTAILKEAQLPTAAPNNRDSTAVVPAVGGASRPFLAVAMQPPL